MALLFTLPAWSADQAVARISTSAEYLDLNVADVAEAAPAMDEGGPVVALRLAHGASEAFAALTARSVGETLTFSICGEVIVHALVRGRLDGQALLTVESQSDALFYARVLKGELSC